MTPAGDYNTPFLRLVYSGVVEATGGQKQPTFANGDTLLGALSLDQSLQGSEIGSIQTQQTGTIRFRGYPALDPKDRFTNLRFGETYLVRGIRRGHLEMIVDVEHFDGLNNIEDQ
jgi:hypothetical protein